MEPTNLIPFMQKKTFKEVDDRLCLVVSKPQDQALKQALKIHEASGFLAFLSLKNLLRKNGSYKDFSDLSFSTLYLPSWSHVEPWEKNQIKDFITSLRGSFSPKLIIGVRELKSWNLF